MKEHLRVFAVTIAMVVGVACGATTSTGNTPPEGISHRVERQTQTEAEPRFAAAAKQSEQVVPNAPAKESALESPALRAGPVLRPTAYERELKALALEPERLPKMAELNPQQRFKLMKLISNSLGVECEDCHNEDDYAEERPIKSLVRFMWDEMTRRHRLEEGPVFCDSCHQGSLKNLERADGALVEHYMKEQFAGRLLLTQSDSPAGDELASFEVGCRNCHGQPFVPEILERFEGMP